MKIVGLAASPRRQGNTHRLLAYFLDSCSRLGAQTTFYSTCDYRVDFCRACEQCMRRGDCPVPDDYLPLLPAIMEADALVLATPNYAFDWSGQLKTVIDRSHAFLYYTQALKGKYGVGICVAGHPAMSKAIAKRCGQAVWLCGGAYVGALTGISKHRDKKGFIHEKKVYAQADKIAQRLVHAIQTHRPYGLQQWLRETFIVSKLKKIFTRRQQEFPYVYQRLCQSVKYQD